MKKHKWLAPTLWFAIPILLLGGIQLWLDVAPLFATSDAPTFIGGMKYLSLMVSDPLFGRFLINTVLISSATPLLFSVAGGLFWLILRNAPLSTPVRYVIVCGGTTLLAAVVCLLLAVPDLPQYLQLMDGAMWRLLWTTLLRHGLTGLQCGVFACLFHFICETIFRRRAKKSDFTETE